MTSQHRRLRRRHQRQQARAPIKALLRQAQELRRQQRQDREDRIVLTMLHCNDLEYDLGKVRPKLQRATTFAEASAIPNLNTDKAEFFKKTY
jgi:hypothetical protein